VKLPRLLLNAGTLGLIVLGLQLQAGPAPTPAAPPPGTPLRFVVVGDTQSASGGAINGPVVAQLIQDMNALNPDFAFFCGDLVSGASTVSATSAQWQTWLNATSSFTGTRYAVPGNHDFYGGAGSFAAWRATFPWLPQANSPAGEEGLTYYFDVGNSRFISILTDHETQGAVPPTQQAWLDSVLASSTGMEHVFVFSHHPLSFSSVEVLGTTSGPFWQSLVQNDVDAYFAGHWHRYQPSQLGNGGDTWEVILGTGGGWQGFQPIRPYQQVHGFVLVEVDGTEATGTFYADADGDGAYDDPVDEFIIATASPAPPGIVAKYDFEDGTARDTAPPPLGKGIDGQLQGGATIAAGAPSGSALELDGVNDHVEAGAIGDYILSLNKDLTLALRARHDGLVAGQWSNTLVTYATSDYYSEDEETNYSYWLSVQSNGTLVSFWEHDNGANVTLTSTTPAALTQGQWHHFALVRDASAELVRFYVDGQQVGGPVAYSEAATGGGRGMLYIGSDVVGATPFHGAIDEVRIYNKALTPAEVQQLADGPSVGYCPPATNSTGGAAELTSLGPLSSLLLSASPVPNNWGVFFFGDAATIVPFGAGNRCVGGQIQRIAPPVLGAGNVASSSFLDLSGTGYSPLYLQLWYRDPAGGGGGFNLSTALMFP